jgi:hypothetical protein
MELKFNKVFNSNPWLTTGFETTSNLVFLTHFDLEFYDIIQNTSGVMLRE